MKEEFKTIDDYEFSEEMFDILKKCYYIAIETKDNYFFVQTPNKKITLENPFYEKIDEKEKLSSKQIDSILKKNKTKLANKLIGKILKYKEKYPQISAIDSHDIFDV